MENYLLCGELSPSSSPGEDGGEDGESGSIQESQNRSGRMKVYKGRKRGTVEFCGIWKHSKAVKDLVANGVSISSSQNVGIKFRPGCLVRGVATRYHVSTLII